MPQRTQNGRFKLSVTLGQAERDALLQVLADARESGEHELKANPDLNVMRFVAASRRIERALGSSL